MYNDLYIQVEAVDYGDLEIHAFKVRSNLSDVHVILVPEVNDTVLEVFLRREETPTSAQHHIRGMCARFNHVHLAKYCIYV